MQSPSTRGAGLGDVLLRNKSGPSMGGTCRKSGRPPQWTHKARPGTSGWPGWTRPRQIGTHRQGRTGGIRKASRRMTLAFHPATDANRRCHRLSAAGQPAGESSDDHPKDHGGDPGNPQPPACFPRAVATAGVVRHQQEVRRGDNRSTRARRIALVRPTTPTRSA